MASLAAPAGIARKRVLVAEDDPLIAMFAEAAIREFEGDCVGCAASISDALALLAETAPDLILLDVHLEGGNSAAVVEAAKARRIPVLISSGSGPGCDQPPFSGLPVLGKPWTSAELAIAVQSMVALPL
jgi:CheY-like chemotaxis protein